jgi:colanic acid/amylovoran biosynthesis glycosyltransferase
VGNSHQAKINSGILNLFQSHHQKCHSTIVYFLIIMNSSCTNKAMTGSDLSSLRLALFAPHKDAVSETFIKAHAERLPFTIIPRYGQGLSLIDASGSTVRLNEGLFNSIIRRIAPRHGNDFNNVMAKHLRAIKADAVLAEYGTTGSYLAPACQKANVPLFVHFHGFDASVKDLLEKCRTSYKQMFDIASGIVVVSKAMHEQVLRLGAKPERLYLNTYGVDSLNFSGGKPQNSLPEFLAVGRFVEKKAPFLTILAFSYVVKVVPDAKLTMVGDGPLIGPCKHLANALGISNFVKFLGVQDSEQVRKLMREARAFVQHSLVAETGDSEGTPVGIIEAQMTGLPVVATHHAGIPDVVTDGKTGFLVDEGDAVAMADCMCRLAKSPETAGRMGEAARVHALAHFTIDRHLNNLTQMIVAGTSAFAKSNCSVLGQIRNLRQLEADKL